MPTDFAHEDTAPKLRSRADLTAYLAGLGAEIRAEHYMLLAVIHDRDRSDADGQFLV